MRAREPRPPWYLTSLLLACLSGCATARHVVPERLLGDVSVFGLRDIRAVSGSSSNAFRQDFIGLLTQEERAGYSLFDFTASHTYSMLAISGGAANGAYGAGVLNGWSESGTRPEFKVVTGISTGAIIAPFAFLGSAYDARLKEFYTSYSTKDIAQLRFPRLWIPLSNSIASSRPLERLIDRYIDQALLDEVAAEHRKGRRLYVGTTNLDAERLVIWDMGKIAASGGDRALELFRKLILASASMPVAFPPVYLHVEANGVTYDEMHVDGGVTKQVFFLFDVLLGFDEAVTEKRLDVSRNQYVIYVIRNGYVDPGYTEVPDRLSAISERTVNVMTNAQSIGDLYQLYVFAHRRKGDFNLAYIPAGHVPKSKELFDPVAMLGLFELGYREAAAGYPWQKYPPGLRADQ